MVKSLQNAFAFMFTLIATLIMSTNVATAQTYSLASATVSPTPGTNVTELSIISVDATNVEALNDPADGGFASTMGSHPWLSDGTTTYNVSVQDNYNGTFFLRIENLVGGVITPLTADGTYTLTIPAGDPAMKPYKDIYRSYAFEGITWTWTIGGGDNPGGDSGDEIQGSGTDSDPYVVVLDKAMPSGDNYGTYYTFTATEDCALKVDPATGTIMYGANWDYYNAETGIVLTAGQTVTIFINNSATKVTFTTNDNPGGDNPGGDNPGGDPIGRPSTLNVTYNFVTIDNENVATTITDGATDVDPSATSMSMVFPTLEGSNPYATIAEIKGTLSDGTNSTDISGVGPASMDGGRFDVTLEAGKTYTLTITDVNVKDMIQQEVLADAYNADGLATLTFTTKGGSSAVEPELGAGMWSIEHDAALTLEQVANGVQVMWPMANEEAKQAVEDGKMYVKANVYMKTNDGFEKYPLPETMTYFKPTLVGPMVSVDLFHILFGDGVTPPTEDQVADGYVIEIENIFIGSIENDPIDGITVNADKTFELSQVIDPASVRFFIDKAGSDPVTYEVEIGTPKAVVEDGKLYIEFEGNNFAEKCADPAWGYSLQAFDTQLDGDWNAYSVYEDSNVSEWNKVQFSAKLEAGEHTLVIPAGNLTIAQYDPNWMLPDVTLYANTEDITLTFTVEAGEAPELGTAQWSILPGVSLTLSQLAEGVQLVLPNADEAAKAAAGEGKVYVRAQLDAMNNDSEGYSKIDVRYIPADYSFANPAISFNLFADKFGDGDVPTADQVYDMYRIQILDLFIGTVENDPLDGPIVYKDFSYTVEQVVAPEFTYFSVDKSSATPGAMTLSAEFETTTDDVTYLYITVDGAAEADYWDNEITIINLSTGADYTTDFGGQDDDNANVVKFKFFEALPAGDYEITIPDGTLIASTTSIDWSHAEDYIIDGDVLTATITAGGGEGGDGGEKPEKQSIMSGDTELVKNAELSSIAETINIAILEKGNSAIFKITPITTMSDPEMGSWDVEGDDVFFAMNKVDDYHWTATSEGGVNLIAGQKYKILFRVWEGGIGDNLLVEEEFYIYGASASAINALKAAEKAGVKMYNLNGARVNGSAKGVIIMNGKKAFVK